MTTKRKARNLIQAVVRMINSCGVRGEEDRYACAFQNIVTALRGPDHLSAVDKYKVTGVIRHAVGVTPYPAGLVVNPSHNLDEALLHCTYLMKDDRGMNTINSHFVNHGRRAIAGLKLLGLPVVKKAKPAPRKRLGKGQVAK